MIKLIKIAFKKDMIKVNENGKEVWYECDKAAKGYASKNFTEATLSKDNKTVLEEGSEIELVLEQRNIEGKNVQCVVQVRKPGQAAAPAPQASSQPSASTPAPALTSSTTKQNYGQKSPEESERITRLSVMSSAVASVQALTGRIETVEQLSDTVLFVYNRLLAEIKK
jgi:hypothetical protein